MMTRKERRAAEHAARKAARKAGFPTTVAASAAPAPAPTSCQVRESGALCENSLDCPACTAYMDEKYVLPQPKPPLSDARLEANRQNAKLSTGPTSEVGKLKVSTNALKTGLTGRTVLLPFDDRDAYEALLLSYQKEFSPVGPVETGLVQSIIDTVWRLERIPALEYAVLEIGHSQLRQADPTKTLNTPTPTLELQIRAMHEKVFRNFHIQENRLTRRREREMTELRTLQETRKLKEAEELKIAAQAAIVAEHNQQPFNLEDLGFEFTPQRFATYMARLTPAMKQNILKEAAA